MSTSKKLVVAGALVVVASWVAMICLYVWLQRRGPSPGGGAGAWSQRAAGAASAKAVPVELAAQFNAQLDQPWNSTSYAGDDLAELPRGRQVFAGVPFAIRGVIQLQGGVWKERGCTFPEKAQGIPVHRACRCLCLLHADGGASARPGTTVATLVLHYRDGTEAALAIKHDIHVKDWWDYGRSPPSDPGTVVAWTGQNKATAGRGNRLRLYLTRFDNPQPAKAVETVDYVSAMAPPGPFMVAMTVE
jgi:hypothetical protein